MPARSSNPSPGAVRNRRYRRRKREKLTLAKSEVPDSITDALIECGWLDEEQAENEDRLGEAVLKAAEAHLMSAIS